MELRARTENNRVVNFEGSADLIGQFVDVKITDVFANSLRGEIVRTEKTWTYVPSFLQHK